jgi:hypothetical protein
LKEVDTKDEVQKLKDDGIIAVVPPRKPGGMRLWAGIINGNWTLDPTFPDVTTGMIS